MLRLLVSAGGTGGGVYPALAVVEALGSSAEVLWIGGEGGMEVSLIARTGIPFQAIPAAGVHGVGLSQLPGNLWRLMRGAFAARNLVRTFHPDVIFFTGGYVGIPVAYASGRIPKVVYTPDIEPGKALRVISRRADLITVTSEESIRYYGKRNVKVTGYPTRKALRSITRDQALAEFGLSDDLPIVLVMGGSRGARSLNQALWRVLPHLLGKVQIIHLTGTLDFSNVDSIRETLDGNEAERYHVFDYLHEKMPCALAVADLAVSRAGASVLGEYTLLGLPSVLIPYPHAWRYQHVNAEYLKTRGAAEVLLDDELDTLLDTVMEILNDPPRLRAMKEAGLKLGSPDAAASIANELRKYERQSS